MTHTTKHTPGPWSNGVGTLEITHKGDQEVIAYVAVRSKGLAGSVEGNMNLIAAAPAMYEALRNAAEWLNDMSCEHGTEQDDGMSKDCVVCQVNAALAQAEGRDK